MRESAVPIKRRPAAARKARAGGTLLAPFNSNCACMGVPPDDMIGILTQTNIQNRIRMWQHK